MPTATRTFRVFVSSTFEDLKAERDALQRDVFPKLRKLCEQNGARFQAIDLRWGVRDEAALDQQTMEICLREIQRCQDRHQAELHRAARRALRLAPAAGANRGRRIRKVLPVTSQTPMQATDRRVVWRDENAVPPEYSASSRAPASSRDEAIVGDSSGAERSIASFAKAARAAGLAPRIAIKYEASATHQEILTGLGQSEEDRNMSSHSSVSPPRAQRSIPGCGGSLKRTCGTICLRDVRPFQLGETEKLCQVSRQSLKQGHPRRGQQVQPPRCAGSGDGSA